MKKQIFFFFSVRYLKFVNVHTNHILIMFSENFRRSNNDTYYSIRYSISVHCRFDFHDYQWNFTIGSFEFHHNYVREKITEEGMVFVDISSSSSLSLSVTTRRVRRCDLIIYANIENLIRVQIIWNQNRHTHLS